MVFNWIVSSFFFLGLGFGLDLPLDLALDLLFDFLCFLSAPVVLARLRAEDLLFLEFCFFFFFFGLLSFNWIFVWVLAFFVFFFFFFFVFVFVFAFVLVEFLGKMAFGFMFEFCLPLDFFFIVLRPLLFFGLSSDFHFIHI